jgi:2EXR family protein
MDSLLTQLFCARRCKITMAYQTLPQFQRLPVELQTQIWNAAIRPNRPGLQYLEIRVLNEPYEDAPDWHTVDVPGSNLFAKENESLWTTEPQQDASWTSDFQRIRRAKESAYFWDAGLWRACKASREIILTHVRHAQFARLILKFQPERHPDLTIRVDPREDLFVVEKFKLGNYVDSCDELIRSVPTFHVCSLQRSEE